MKEYPPIHRIENAVCHECGKPASLTHDPTEIPGKGGEEGFIYSRPILQCTDPACGEEFVAPEDAKELHDSLCLHGGLLLPEEIKEIREEFGRRNEPSGKISQKNFAERIGFGRSTIARYEARLQVQNKASDILLRACRELPGFDDLVAASFAKDQSKKQAKVQELGPMAKAFRKQNGGQDKVTVSRANIFHLNASRQWAA